MTSSTVDNSKIVKCPKCASPLDVSKQVACTHCNTKYEIHNGIPLMFTPSEFDTNITQVMKSFYEENPFPNYEDFETLADLVQKAEKGFFAKVLNEQIPFNTRILEVGCGTGQLSNYLGIAHRYVYGTDMCINSLKLAHEFKTKHDLERVNFYQMNLFKPIFLEESFHLVVCNGVLHHTNNPLEGFKSISKLVKKGGYIIIGLYNTYGRLFTGIRSVLYKIFGSKLSFLDPQLLGKGKAKTSSWFMDQYKNPHESWHTIGEALHWFDTCGFDFVYGIPNVKAFERFNPSDSIFKKHERGNSIDHGLVQLNMLLSGSKEGGLFILIGKKK